MERLLLLSLLFSLLLLAVVSPATGVSISAETQARKLIRGLNLFPKHAVNIVNNRSSLPPSKKIVEKAFKFPNFVDSDDVSVEDLGHHAGYYQIQHSHDAQYTPHLSLLIHFILFYYLYHFLIN